MFTRYDFEIGSHVSRHDLRNISEKGLALIDKWVVSDI